MPQDGSAYDRLTERFRRIGALREAAAVLHWDTAAMMPPGGAEPRAEQLAALDVTCHELLTDPVVADGLDRAEAGSAALDAWSAANLREMRRQWRHAAALDGALVAALTKAESRCEMAWREARPAGDFAAVLPALREQLALVRESVAARAAALGCAPYDALLDRYEPGATSARIDELFADLAAFLPGFLDQVLSRQARGPKPLPLEGRFARGAQQALSLRLMQMLGFDLDRGRLDVSRHPFCGGVPGDVRITTRFDEADVVSGLMAVLHETGHALYESGLPADWRLQPVGDARGMALHESQSLLIEMQVCRSRPFVGLLAPLLREAFDLSGPAGDVDNLARLYTWVEPGLIRVDADEVTYPAHVILRYRLERQILDGALDLADLPEAWNRGMQELLGVVPPHDGLGCLQDIHWYDGAWGYFPTYTLGAMAAAQLFAAARAAVADLSEALAAGNFRPLVAWLRDNVHAYGSLYSTDELLERVTGRPLDPEAFKTHLRARYLS